MLSSKAKSNVFRFCDGKSNHTLLFTGPGNGSTIAKE